MNELEMPGYRRGIEQITMEIREETEQFLRAAIRIGRLLFEAKAMVPQGDWGRYIEEQLPFSHSWANNYMKLYKEYGSEQISMFGNSQAIMNLRPTQALELLRLDPEERERFVEEHNVESMSTRQLRQEIQEELDRAQEKQLDLARQLEGSKADMEDLREDLEKMEDTARKAKAEVDRLEKLVEETRKARDKEAQEAEKLKPKLEKAKAAEKKAKEQLKRLQENPQIPETVMEEMRQQVAAEAAKEATEEIQKKLDAALAYADASAKAARAAEEQLAAAQKVVKLANPEAVAFKVKFEKLQADFSSLMDDMKRMRKDTPEMVEGFTKGIRALLELWQQKLEV